MPLFDSTPVMAELPDYITKNCLVMDADGTVRHGPCDGSANTPAPVAPVPVYIAIPGATPAAVTVSPASNLMPLLLVGAVLWLMAKN